MTYPPSMSEASNNYLPILGSELRPMLGVLVFWSAVVLASPSLEETPDSLLSPHALKSNAVNNGIKILDMRLVVKVLTLLSVKPGFCCSLFRS